MNIKPLTRYNFGEFDSGLKKVTHNCQTDVIYVKDLTDRLHQMLTDACDPAETDTLNTIIKLLEA